MRIVKLIRTFPGSVDGTEVGRQLLKAGTSIGANYREANRAESRDDFVPKVGVAEKEASETVYWLEICEAAPLGNAADTIALLKEANELLAIITTVGRKAKGRSRWIGATAISVMAALLSFPLFAFSLSTFHFMLSAFPLSAFHFLP